MRRRVVAVAFVVVAASISGCDFRAADSSTADWPEATFDGKGEFFNLADDTGDGPTQLVYVPVYSRLLLSKESVSEMAISLSIRNTDPGMSLIVHEIEYFDTAGKRLSEYLESAYELDPMTTVTLTLPQWDTRGGSGANFLVRWSGEPGINAPIIEAVMAGTRGNQSFSLIRAGQDIDE